MANPAMHVRFWNWYHSGPYFGMPVQNLAGWTRTAAAFMLLSRLLWRADIDARSIPAWFPSGMYLANTGFAVALSLGAGLWQPVVVGALLAATPALLLLRMPPHRAQGVTAMAARQPEP